MMIGTLQNLHNLSCVGLMQKSVALRDGCFCTSTRQRVLGREPINLILIFAGQNTAGCVNQRPSAINLAASDKISRCVEISASN